MMTFTKLKPTVLVVFEGLTKEVFTVDELTEAYLNNPLSLHRAKKPARQFIYRILLRLLKNGELEKLANGRRWPQYKFTQKFKLRIKTAPTSLEAELLISKPTIQYSSSSFRERLARFKLEMLTAMGEAEEYDAICAEMPEMRPQIQKLYDESRDRCSKLLGRVKALESLISTGAK